MARPATALILQHHEDTPPGLLGQWLDERSIAATIHDTTSEGAPWPDPSGYGFVCCLGAEHSPRDVDRPAVKGTRRVLEQAVERDVPVLGLCFGGQLLASVLGGEVELSPHPERGWATIDTDDPAAIPPGPWLQWHYDRFSLPPGATELARNAAAVQAFRLGPHLGTQFHPESTVEIVSGWAAIEADRLKADGLDGATLLAASRAQRDQAAADALQLFDAFWQSLDPETT